LNTANPDELLKQYYGYDRFREGQKEIITALLTGRDAFGVMPTGAGKSVCYQIPALILPGVTLVISPLISLMRDQVQALRASGIAAAYINSSLTSTQIDAAMTKAANGKYKIVYVAPERLKSLTLDAEISFVAVDEAHCISQWGHDFRTSYLDIPRFVESLPKRPVLAGFTATATAKARDDIIKMLGLRSPFALTTGFDRPNLRFEVRHPQDKYQELKTYMGENDGNGIIYCSTRKEVESVTEKLRRDGFSAARYHAGLTDDERSRAQDDFLYDRTRIIIATNAFGMGIDKSDVRFVIHYNMPQNVEAYYQEAGRAGRDGLPSECILFYSRRDIMTALFLINKSENPDEIQRNKQLLNQMERYCQTDGCLRQYLLEYFGERARSECGNCGNCGGDDPETDASVDAQKILSCIWRINKQNRSFGFGVICKMLLGKPDQYILSRKLDEIPTFGKMSGEDANYIRRVYDRLVFLGYIAVRDDRFRTATITDKTPEVLFDGTKVYVRGEKPESGKKASSRGRKSEPPRYGFSQTLFDKLKAVRLEMAKESGVPAFVVFSDATLVDMAQKRPQNETAMLDVSGVGSVKFERYGQRFLAILREDAAESGATGGDANAGVEAGADSRPELSLASFLRQIEITDTPIQITRVADSFNAVFLQYGQARVSGQGLNKLLLENGYLEVVDNAKLPTEKGAEAGITTIERHSERGAYRQCLFGRETQRILAELAFAARL
jgi:ATP-dependent DNA helicase RecQ